MGDTGSLALGGAAAVIAMTTSLPWDRYMIAAAPIWAILGSVIVQVSVFKVRRWTRGLEYARAHRVFRRTPLHHHFEELGVPENRIVMRLWIAEAVCCALAAI
jgi:phospho-N-acetylmuramoyl-pentapeptide-transferase